MLWTPLIGLVLACGWAAAEPPRAATIRFARDRDVLYLNAGDVAVALDLELKIIDPARLVTFCREGDRGYCIPLRLAANDHRRDGEQFLIAADALGRALRFRAVETGGSITLAPRAELATNDAPLTAPGYNAPWEPGRGFGKGDTLPDIPLVDMAGNEVRFSQFLGRRYILFCWASW